MTELREDTMLYRKPTADSDDSQVSEIWGKQLETKVVDADEVAEFIADGWVTHPDDLDGKRKKPEAKAGFEQVDNAKVKAAEKRVAELTSSNKQLAAELDAAKKAAAEAEELLKAAETERDDAIARAKAAEAGQTGSDGN